MDEDRAKELASEAGFPAPTITLEESTELAGTVIAQSPKAGTRADRSTLIKLTIAKPKPSTPPSTPPPSSSSPSSSASSSESPR